MCRTYYLQSLLLLAMMGCSTIPQNKIERDVRGNSITFTGVIRDTDDNRALLLARATAFRYIKEECKAFPSSMSTREGEVMKVQDGYLAFVKVSVVADECETAKMNPQNFLNQSAQDLVDAYDRTMGILEERKPASAEEEQK